MPSTKVSRKDSLVNRATCGGPIKAGLVPRATNFMFGNRNKPNLDKVTDYPSKCWGGSDGGGLGSSGGGSGGDGEKGTLFIWNEANGIEQDKLNKLIDKDNVETIEAHFNKIVVLANSAAAAGNKDEKLEKQWSDIIDPLTPQFSGVVQKGLVLYYAEQSQNLVDYVWEKYKDEVTMLAIDAGAGRPAYISDMETKANEPTTNKIDLAWTDGWNKASSNPLPRGANMPDLWKYYYGQFYSDCALYQNYSKEGDLKTGYINQNIWNFVNDKWSKSYKEEGDSRVVGLCMSDCFQYLRTDTDEKGNLLCKDKIDCPRSCSYWRDIKTILDSRPEKFKWPDLFLYYGAYTNSDTQCTLDR